MLHRSRSNYWRTASWDAGGRIDGKRPPSDARDSAVARLSNGIGNGSWPPEPRPEVAHRIMTPRFPTARLEISMNALGEVRVVAMRVGG